MKHPPILKGLKLSILGDSISSFAGTIPEGHKVYYTGKNSGVSAPQEMWWSIVCDELGLEPLVINAWSGSTVTRGVRDLSVYLAASDETRCQALHRGETLPDIVLIAMGVNDYSYGAPLGDWDGRTPLNGDVSNFRAAYATMLERIHSRYPFAFIGCITPWFMQRGTDTGSCYVNEAFGLTAEAYGQAMSDVARLMGCAVIDGTHIGFNRWNYYAADGSRYCQDRPDRPTHPNARGQRCMGLAVARALEALWYSGETGGFGHCA